MLYQVIPLQGKHEHKYINKQLDVQIAGKQSNDRHAFSMVYNSDLGEIAYVSVNKQAFKYTAILP